MSTNDIQSYLANNYTDFLKPVSELSKSDQGKVLVEDERKLYNFDKITEKLYPNCIPESVDSLYVLNNKVLFVEYKSGFKKKISKDNFKKEKMSCPDDSKKFCQPYAKLFFDNQKKEDKVLYYSIHQKAIESYMTFMKGIVPEVENNEQSRFLMFCVVIDDYVENMEDILNGLSKKSSDSNLIGSMRQSLSRFRKMGNKDYYYDEIKVFSPHEFIRFLDENMR